MPQNFILLIIIEAFFIIFTLFFLIQPRFIFRIRAVWLTTVFRWLGYFLLFLTFLWSILLGVVLSLNQYEFGIFS